MKNVTSSIPCVTFSGGETAGGMQVSAGLQETEDWAQVNCQEKKKKIEGTLKKTGLVHN